MRLNQHVDLFLKPDFKEDGSRRTIPVFRQFPTNLNMKQAMMSSGHYAQNSSPQRSQVQRILTTLIETVVSQHLSFFVLTHFPDSTSP